MSGGQVFDRRDGRLLATLTDHRDAATIAHNLNLAGHRARADRLPGPGNPARYVSQTIAEVGWIAALQRLGWWVDMDGDRYVAHPPRQSFGSPTVLGLVAHVTEGDAWAAARRWHNNLKNGQRAAQEPKL